MIIGSKKLFTLFNILIVGVIIFGAASACNYSYTAPAKHHQVVKHHHPNPVVNNSTKPPVTPPANNSTNPPPIVVNNSTTPPVVNNTTVTPPPVVGTPNFIVNSGQSIQNAINSAKTGDLIIVNPGTYSGFTLNKGVTVQGNGTVNLNSPVSISSGILKGFTITADYAVAISNSNGVQILNNIIKTLGQTNAIMDTGINEGLIVANNIIIGGSNVYGNGMAFEGSTNDAQILNNTITNTLHGILFDVVSSNDIIANNTVIGNGLISNGEAGIDYQGAGIYTIIGSTGFNILNNYVSGERDGIAIQPLGSGTATGMVVQGNTLNNNINGLWMQMNNAIVNANKFNGNVNAIDITGTGNLIENNIIKTSSNCDVALSTSASTDVNTLVNNTYTGIKGLFYNVGPGKVTGE